MTSEETARAKLYPLMPGLQALRFLAAFGVFAHHLVAYARATGVIAPDALEFARYGASGVPVFFALSGFLMAMLSENARPAEFLWRRCLRIYPGLWLAVAVAVAVKLIFLGTLQREYDWLLTLTLVPAGKIAYPLNVEWTLVFEVFFYAFVAVLCLIPSMITRKIIVIAWGATIIFFGKWSQHGFFFEIAMSQINIAFITGMLAWWCRNYLEFRGPLAFIAALVILFFCRNSLTVLWLQFHIGIAISAALMVLVASRATMFSPTGILKKLGDASYGLYLIHAVIMATAFTLIGRPSWFWFAVVGGLSLTVSILFGVFESRFHTFLARKANSWPSRLSARLKQPEFLPE